MHSQKLMPAIKYVSVLLAIIILAQSCKPKPDDPTPATVNPAAGTGSFIFNGTTYNGACTIFSSNMSQAGRLDEITITSSQFGVGYSPEFIIDYMPVASTGSFPFAAGATGPLPYQPGTVYGFCLIIKGQGTNQSGYYVKSGSLSKTGPSSFKFNCVVFDAANSSTTFNVTGSGTYQ